MKRVMFVGLLMCSGLSDTCGADRLEDLTRCLADFAVKTATSPERTAFTLMGRGAPGRDNDVAELLGIHYRGFKRYHGVTITSLLPLGAAGAKSAWEHSTRRCGVIANVLQRQGVAAGGIEIHVRCEPDVSEEGLLVVSFHRKRDWFSRMGDNLVTGVTNVVASPVELPKGVMTTGRKEGAIVGGTVGVLGGFGSAVRRAGTGAVQLLTFWAG